MCSSDLTNENEISLATQQDNITADLTTSSNNQSHNEKTNGQLQQLQTKIATHVSYVIGNTERVQHFDKKRAELHRRPNSKYIIERYKNDLAVIQHQVFWTHKQLKREIAKWEEE